MDGPVTFDATIAALQTVVDRCAAGQERAGYFAARYLAVTQTVRVRTEAGRAAGTQTEAWRIAFDASGR